MQTIRRPLLSMLKAQKAAPYGLSASLRQPVHHQFTTSFLTKSLRKNRYGSRVQNPSRVHLHILGSESSTLASIVRTFRVPIMMVIIVFGGCWYASYKFGELKRWMLDRWIQAGVNNVKDTVTNTGDTAVNSLKALWSHASEEVKRPDAAQALISTVKDTATNVGDTAVKGFKAVESRVSEVKLPDIPKEATKFIKDLFGKKLHKEGDGEGEQQSNKKPPTDKR
ncbi:uncharacterized protein EV420DRAFT_1473125 [Desarmillaria tabescens]|uniref:Uncharacterized protein n=1 Tax=Armillaria tabescens TaxID=1929756 RepID=A0AA39NQV6_ARMTA|nr:uncharacterized protein EV420DRAFT_1473125 [Desarmillaria tabescens]KAK0470015.1 hypothetical protein EV420DRAFT_1473125 [Desarmillaria tabescens]